MSLCVDMFPFLELNFLSYLYLLSIIHLLFLYALLLALKED